MTSRLYWYWVSFSSMFFIYLPVGFGKLCLDHILQLIEQKKGDGQGGDQADQKCKDDKLRKNAVRIDTLPFHNITSMADGSVL